METINDIIINEFVFCGYRPIIDFKGRMFICSTNGSDYWLVSQNPNDFNKQKELYDRIIELSTDMRFVEKNLSLLLLVDMDNPDNEKLDTIKIENEKSYFKKYVLMYNQDSVKGLIGIITEKKVKSVAELVLDTQYFNQLQSDTGQLTPITLLYSIAHKLPFIPINSTPVVRTDTNLNMTENLVGLMQWVMNAPDNSEKIEKYVIDSININEVNE